ncbi:hypothetical protein VitviT2T_020578 [Vitis vinifera]|uniref:Uncharacterized protein n=1 Tax=Vitis vinifera TaxID=29760 RepID=A0ABY9D5Z8_VITVI|nr:hypothetical protein VitviT2T_020578 [Vitis vinifera]
MKYYAIIHPREYFRDGTKRGRVHFPLLVFLFVLFILSSNLYNEPSGAYGMSQLAHIIVYIIQEKKLSYMLGLKARRINHFDKVHVLK